MLDVWLAILGFGLGFGLGIRMGVVLVLRHGAEFRLKLRHDEREGGTAACSKVAVGSTLVDFGLQTLQSKQKVLGRGTPNASGLDGIGQGAGGDSLLR